MDKAVVTARTALLDAFEALHAHLGALVIVGAQAVYMHTGAAPVALAEFTTDADVAIDPDLLSSDPLVEAAMLAGGFKPDPRTSAIGTWISSQGVPADLMIPDSVAGSGRRSVKVPPHDRKSMRRTRGLEAALVDNSKMLIQSLNPELDTREFLVPVAGPAALLVAKLHKIGDRLGEEGRQNNKDAHDVYRILIALESESLATSIKQLLTRELSQSITEEAMTYLRDLFAAGANAPGSRMAGAAEELVGDPESVSESVALLAQDLLAAI